MYSIIRAKDTQHRVNYRAAVLGFFFLMRSSEFLQANGSHHHYCIRVNDFTVLDHNGQETTNYNQASTVDVHFRGSKNDQEGRGFLTRMAITPSVYGTSRTGPTVRKSSPDLCPCSWVSA